MTLIVSDSFAGPAGRSRITSSGQVGAVYLLPGWTTQLPTLSGDGHLSPSATAGSSALLANGTSVSGNLTLNLTLRMTGAVPSGCSTNFIARGPAAQASINGYFLAVMPSGLQIQKWVASAQANLTSTVALPSAADVYSIAWTLIGTAQAVQVSRASDGKYLTSAGAWQSAAATCLTCTDTTFTNGVCGVWYYTASGTTTAEWGPYTVNDDGVAVTPMPTVNVVWHGDSLTYGTNGTNLGTLLATRLAAVVNGLGSTATYSVYGNPGHTIEQMITELPTVVALLDPTKKNVLTAQGGHNSYNAGDTSAQVESLIQQYVAAALSQAAAAGCELQVAWTTELPAAYPGYPANFDALRDASNTWLRANYAATGITALSDVASNATIGQDGDEQNTTYFSSSDHTHLTDAGYTIWGGSYDLPAVQYAVNLPTIAPANTPTATGATLTANATGTYAPLTYAWSGTGITFSNSAVANPIATVTVAGTYVARLTVTDARGQKATGTTTFTANSTMAVSPATITAGVPQAVAIGGGLLAGVFTYAGQPTGTVIGTTPRAAGYQCTVTAPTSGSVTITDATGVSRTLTIIPAQPAPPTVVATSGSTAVSWAPAAGAATYELSRNGSVVYTGANLAYPDTGLTNGVAVAYTVVAIDASSRRSARSGATTVTPSVPTLALGSAADVTPSDTVDLPFVSREIRATFTGTVAVIPLGGTSPVTIPVAAGVPLVMPATRIMATGTTTGGTIAVLS